MKKAVVLIVSILLIIGAGAALYWSSSGNVQPVRMVRVQLAALQRSISTNGTVEAEKVFEIRAPFPGACIRISAANGDQMKGGQAILTVDNPSLRSDLTAARSELNAAEVDVRNMRRGPTSEELNQAEAEITRIRTELENAQKDLATNERLLERNAISRSEVEQSRRQLVLSEQLLEAAQTRRDDLKKIYDQADLRRATSRVEAARSRIGYLEANIAREIIRAPADGTLYQFSVKEGAYVNTGDLIGLFADLTRLRVRAYVDEPDLGRVSRGAEVRIHWDARPETDLMGTVRMIPPEVVSRGTRSVAEVLCSIDGPSEVLIPNINVDLEIAAEQGPKLPVLSRDAILQEGKDQFVWLLREGKAEKRFVQTGRSTSSLVELSAGLSLGDEVIIPGDALIQEGTRVRVIGE